jgi:hypothetical protein
MSGVLHVGEGDLSSPRASKGSRVLSTCPAGVGRSGGVLVSEFVLRLRES